MVRASEIADHLDAEHVGPDAAVTGVNSLASATADDLAFRSEGFEFPLSETDAGVVVCPPSTPAEPGTALVRTERPRLGFIEAADAFFVEERAETTVHPTAVVEDGAELGERCYVGANAYVGEAVRAGDGCEIWPGCIVGTEGSHIRWDEEGRIPGHIHDGVVVLGDDVTLHPNCVVQRAVFDETVVGEGTRVGDASTVGHQARLGEHAWVGQNCAINGSVEVGDRATIQPGATIADHTVVGDEAQVGMNSTVLDDVPDGTTVVGSPARPID